MHTKAVSVLVVEDEENLRLSLEDNLRDAGYRVSSAATGQEAREAFLRDLYDLIVLDIVLPDTDGYALCRELRERGSEARVLMLTARTLEDDLVRGFDAGADDYLAKPYRLRELLARAQALTRRAGSRVDACIEFGPFCIDAGARTLRGRDDENLSLTKTEFDLLLCLVRNRDRALSRREILDAVWGEGVAVAPGTIDNFISSLKQKLGMDRDPGFRIQAVRGIGYRMEML